MIWRPRPGQAVALRYGSWRVHLAPLAELGPGPLELHLQEGEVLAAGGGIRSGPRASPVNAAVRVGALVVVVPRGQLSPS